MAFSDWSVEVLDVQPQKNVAKNPYTMQPIDPGGLTTSLVTMNLTHIPTGKVLNRADLFSNPTREAFLAYARGITSVVDGNLAVQGSQQAPSPLAGVLDLEPVPVEVTPDAKAQQAFQTASGVLSQLQALVTAGDLAADDPALAQASNLVTKNRTQAKAADVAALKATLDAVPDVASPDISQPGLVSRARSFVSRMLS